MVGGPRKAEFQRRPRCPCHRLAHAVKGGRTRGSELELRDAEAPSASLISKSEKAQQKLAPGTWQHALLRDNLTALRMASSLMKRETEEILSRDDLEETLRTLASMIAKVERTGAKFAPGTSQHTLQRNRLKALRIAKALVNAESDKR